MAQALLGAGGFVGQHLAQQIRLIHPFTRSNSRSMYPGPYQLLICAAAPGAKWQANRYPEQDQQAIEQIQQLLERTIAEQVVLISTVDVFPEPQGVHETHLPQVANHHAYGRHRYQLEQLVAQRFENHLIVRLPALFGSHLRKNLMYDLLHKRPLDWTHPESTYQWYPIEQLWQDIQHALAAQLRLIHLVSEPISAQEIAKQLFDRTIPSNKHLSPVLYDVHTQHAHHWQQQANYQWSKTSMLARMRHFVEQQQPHPSQASTTMAVAL